MSQYREVPHHQRSDHQPDPSGLPGTLGTAVARLSHLLPVRAQTRRHRGNLGGAVRPDFNGMAALETPEFMLSKVEELTKLLQPLRGRLGLGDGYGIPVDQAGRLAPGVAPATGRSCIGRMARPAARELQQRLVYQR
jgi:hypothetical protein